MARGTRIVKRRTPVNVQRFAIAVMVVSAVLVWVLRDGEGAVAAGRAACFGVFAIASWTLLVAVLVDFDRWVDTVPPVPKRAVRRLVARTARRVGRVLVCALAIYGAGMTWLWSRAGRALGWVLGRSGAGLAWLWVMVVRVGGDVLVGYRAALGWLWSMAGGALGWVLGRSGAGLARLWSSIGRVIAWVFVLVGLVLTRLRWAAVGRRDDAMMKPLRRWFGAAGESVFGIPPDDASVDAVGRRSSPPPPSAQQPSAQPPQIRPDGDTLAARKATRRAPASASAGASRRRKQGPQRVRSLRLSDRDERFLATLSRFRSSMDDSKDRPVDRRPPGGKNPGT
jgi:hypothetical protein